MSQTNHQWLLGLAICLTGGGGIYFDDVALSEQLEPDASLGAARSVVNSNVNINGIPSDAIEGGAIRGSNLFHSFKEFNVGEGQSVYFNNPAGIEHIFSRVSGNNSSKILGKLGVLGNADLFLINPNGIIFGANASLDVKGSFLATTASSVTFADGNSFSAKDTSALPLLTVSVPVGLQFGKSAGAIVNQSQVIDSSGLPVGLEVSQQTLALVGGEIAMQGGVLTATEGRIELGSVAETSFVSLQPIQTGWALGYEGVQNFTDIRLLQGSLINNSGQPSGDIQLQGKNVTLADGSQIFASVLSGAQPGGTLKIKATDSVALIGTNSNGLGSYLVSATLSAGNAGNIIIDTGKLLLQDRASISTESSFTDLISGDVERAMGKSGDLTVNASVAVELNRSELATQSYGFGNAGSLRIATKQLQVSSGAKISSVADSGGTAGDIQVKSDSIRLDNQASILATSVSGNGGNITLQNQNLLILNRGSQISTNAGTEQNAGDGGNITINVPNGFIVAFPGENSDITANAFTGKGGNIQINASGVFGIQRQPENPQTNDITASSQFGVSGTVEIDSLDFNRDKGLVELPSEIIDSANLIANSCITRRNQQQGSFIITGTGGLPTLPDDAANSPFETYTVPVKEARGEVRQVRGTITNYHVPITNFSNSIPTVEAAGIYRLASGEQILGRECP